jgi:hypothetical protein
MLPFEVMADGEVVFVAYDVNSVVEPPKANTKCDKLTELPLSKHKQATGMTARLAQW